jgi:hypothetical protein
VPADLEDVDDLGALAQPEVHRLVRTLVEVFQKGCRDLDQAALHRGPQAELEQVPAEVELPVHPVQQPRGHQLAGQPVQGGLGQPGPPPQLGEADAVVLGGEGVENRRHLADHSRGHRTSVSVGDRLTGDGEQGQPRVVRADRVFRRG